MDEENIDGQDLDNAQELGSVQEEHDLSNVQETFNVQEAHDLSNVQEMGHVQEEHGLSNVQEMGHVQEEHGLSNVQEIGNLQEEHDLTNVQETVQEEYNLSNVQEIDKVQEEHGLSNVQELDNVQEEHSLSNVQELDNVQEEHDLDNVQEIDQVEQNLDNVQEMDNVKETYNELENSRPTEYVLEDARDSNVVEEKKWPGWPGENVFRMLVPAQRVGGIIGRKGEYIKKICEETKARIKILDGPPGSTERTVMVSAKEEPDLTIPPALDGLLKIHKHIIDLGSDAANAPAGGTFCTRLLVAATQAGSLIGKQGATIKSIQDDSHCTIRVIGRGENLPAVALPDDSVVEIQGEPAGLDKAVEIIGTHLRRFLVDRSVIGIFEMQMQMPSGRANQNMHPSQSWGPPHSDFPMNPGGHGYRAGRPYMAPPPHQYDDYYPPADMAFDNQPRSAPPNYGRDISMGAHATNVQPQQAVIAKVTQNIQIQLAYADAVIGVNGANISYIRRTSGATIAIQETRGVPGEMTVEINGSASQVQAAHQLIQNSIADAMSSAPNPSGGYNPYPSHGSGHGSSTSNAAGQASHVPAGDYGSMHGASYGY